MDVVGARAAGTRAAYAAAAVAAVSAAGALSQALGAHRPATLCLLRAATGIPCPLCGTTTAAVSLAEGDVAGALAANPVTVVAVALLVLAPLLRLRADVGRIVAAAIVAEAWQLARFDIV